MNFYSDILKPLHSSWAYLVVIVLVLAALNSVVGMLKKKEYGAKDFRLALFGLIVSHIQLLIGLAIYFSSPMYKNMKEFGVNDVNRQLSIEHPVTMLIALVLITVGYSKHKKKRTSAAKFKTLAVTYSLGLIAILSMIPWKNWLSFLN